MAEGTNRTCFIICAIGDEGTEVRERANKVLKHVMRPAAQACGYEAIRSDQEGRPNQITIGVINHLIDDPIVVADLTHANPNVYYELAIRHCYRQPVVQIIEHTEPVPFDLGNQRTIPLDLTDPDSLVQCRDDLIRQIEHAASNPDDLTTPVSVAADLRAAREAGDPSASLSQAILQEIEAIRSQVDYLHRAEGRRARQELAARMARSIVDPESAPFQTAFRKWLRSKYGGPAIQD